MKLRVHQVSFSVRDTEIIREIDTAFEPGRLTAILGPNGAGKTTLFRLLSGEAQPTTGEVELHKRPLSAIPARTLARHRAVLPQEPSLRFGFSVNEVVRLGRAPYQGESSADQDRWICQRALARVGLDDKGERFYPTLSGGEKQRVHLARVLAQCWEATGDPPAYILLDEPTANLDIAHRHQVLRLGQELTRAGVGVVAILHEINLALSYADDVLLMRQGRIAAQGETVATLTPANIARVFGVKAITIAVPGLKRPQIVTLPSPE